MDYTAALVKIQDQERRRYTDKQISAPEIAKIMRRISLLRQKSNIVLENRERRATIKRKVTKAREFFNGRVVAIDCEFTDDLFYEVGITTHESNCFQTITYVVSGYEHSLKRKAIYGETVVLTTEEIIKIAQKAYNSATLAVFHDFRKDANLLNLDLKNTYFFDTAHFSTLVTTKDTPALSILLNKYSIPTDNLHQAGNDSRRTLELAKEILQIGSEFSMRKLKF